MSDLITLKHSLSRYTGCP